MNGNVTEQGIDLDLNWMSRTHVSGFTVFEGSLDTPQVVPKRLVYMTPDWKRAFIHTTQLAEKLGLEMSIASSPGWSETGGPWVTPPEGMKKMVWSEIALTGGVRFNGKLPPLPSASGTFQDFNVDLHRSNPGEGVLKPTPTFSADAVLLAYRQPTPERSQTDLSPVVTASGGSVNVAALSDGDVETPALSLPGGAPGDEAWVQFDYGKPQTIRSLTLATTDDIASIFGFENRSILPRLEASDNGLRFRTITEIDPSSIPQRTVAFPPVQARYFRVVFRTPTTAKQPEVHQITELVLRNGARINEFEKRAGFATVPDYYAIHDPVVAPEFTVPKSDVIQLTDKMRPDGSLDWTTPPGKWIVLRMGYSLTGHMNGPAPAEATGLEVDKLNAGFVRNYLDYYLKTYSTLVGPENMGKKGITFLLTDSIETGPTNWTNNMLEDFQRLRGYDPRPYLPALTGIIVDSTATSNRFLWDFRRTIAELLAQNHYGTISDILHQHGLRYQGEALEYHRPMLGDDIEMRSKMDIPMGALWDFPGKEDPGPSYVADIRGAASIAHIYGQNLVGAESMTSNGPDWGSSPNTLKRVADMEMALGVNHFEIHESTHQPLLDHKPGLTLGHYGQWFNRNETWADQARPWMDYLARGSYLLQQGRFVGDVAYFYGQEGPLTAVFGYAPQRDAPEGHGFDFINSDILLNRLSFRDDHLVTSTGMSYRLLYLGGTSQRMTLAVLRKIEELVQQGAIVDGQKPVDSPSLADDQVIFQRLADQLWGTHGNGSQPFHSYGKGRVYSGKSANKVLADLGLARDFDYSRPEPDTRLLFLHRQLAHSDLYFVSNFNPRAEQVQASFRVTGKIPELWDPSTGTTSPVSYRMNDDTTTVPLGLASYGSIFVVFRKPTAARSLDVPQPVETELADGDKILNRDWKVTFPPDWGAPPQAQFDRLMSWSENVDPGVRYFSGTATYSKAFEAPRAWFKPTAHLWLDLGTVAQVAEVELNGKPLGILWKNPYRVDLTAALKPGSNELKIKVTNLWVNRLIGDQQPEMTHKYTFTDIKPYVATWPLLPSGMLGPLRLTSAKTP